MAQPIRSDPSGQAGTKTRANVPRRLQGHATPNHLLANQALIELRAAIEGLGGALTPEQEVKYAVALEVRMRLRELTGARAEPISRRERPGRNDPCWCGSSKKYKRCHLDDDDRDARVEV